MLTQLKKLNNFEPFMEEMTSKLSMEKLEEVFGIVIKKNASPKENFNLYKNGELIFAEITEHEIMTILERLAYRMSKIISDKAIEDTDTEIVAKRIAEQEYERSQCSICLECGKRIAKGEDHRHYPYAD